VGKSVVNEERITRGRDRLILSSPLLSVVEEGIDLPSCKYVVSFDGSKFLKSYIQSRGRARYKESKYCRKSIFSENPSFFFIVLDLFLEQSSSMPNSRSLESKRNS
jgi:hypothetical protein